MSETWHYVDKYGTSRGPCTMEELIRGYCCDDLFDQTYVWDGVTVKTWTPIHGIPNLHDHLERSKKHYLEKTNSQGNHAFSPRKGNGHGRSSAEPSSIKQRIPVIANSTTTPVANENQAEFPRDSSTNTPTPVRPSLNKHNTFNVHHQSNNTSKGTDSNADPPQQPDYAKTLPNTPVMETIPSENNVLDSTTKSEMLLQHDKSKNQNKNEKKKKKKGKN